MGKENTFYFTHDYNARSDSKIKRLLSRHGCLGYGLYWSIIEDLYNNANVMQLDYESIAYALRVKESIVNSVINDFDLFVISDDTFGSNSVQRRLDERDSKSKKASESAQERWRRNADALRAQSDSNAIKESKVKENKGKERKGEENKNKINLNKLTPAKDSIFTEMVKIWFDWYELKFSVIPKFGQVDGSKIKSIKKYLETAISKKGEVTDQKIFDAWQLILETSTKHEFVSKNLSLSIIDMKMNEIIALASDRGNDRENKHNQSTRGAAEILAQKHKKENEVRALA